MKKTRVTGELNMRKFFAAQTSGFHIRILELVKQEDVRVLWWSKLTRAERRRGDEFVKLLAPPRAGGPCAWKSTNFPKTEDVAKALNEYVLALESRHGAAIWSPIERLGG